MLSRYTIGGAASFREAVPSAKLFVHWLAVAAPRPRRSLACADWEHFHGVLKGGVSSRSRLRLKSEWIARNAVYVATFRVRRDTVRGPVRIRYLGGRT